MAMALFQVSSISLAQEPGLHARYIGVLPAFLAEPYDTIKALEVNTIPITFEFRLGAKHDLGIQLRPIMNYRFYKDGPGISQVGGTVLVNKYFLGVFEEDFWLKPQMAAYYTFTHNRLDQIETMTFGIEPGTFMRLSDHVSMSVSLQPGINYYPNAYSRAFVNTSSGFKSHFGVLFHIGYNF